MSRAIKAKYCGGVIAPLEKLNFPEGEEITVIIEDFPIKQAVEADLDWSGLSASGFAKDWDNEKDAIYDNWKKLYGVSKR